MESKNTGYVPQLDHLRFVAAALVVVFHTLLALPAPDGTGFRIALLEQGHVGVQLFMVISGYILGVITRDSAISTRKFYLNRVLRIYPLLTIVIALSYFAGNLEGHWTVAQFLFALSPFSNLARADYGAFGGQAWSIAVELQFYLLLPALLSFRRRFGPRYYVSLVLLLIFLRTGVYLTLYAVHSLSYFTIFGALDLFIVGLYAGEISDRITVRRPLLVCIAVFLIINVIAAVLFARGDFSHVRIPTNRLFQGQSTHWLWIVWPDILASLFAVLVVAYVRIPMPGRISRFVATLGQYSYSMYLWQMLVVALVVRFAPAGLTGLAAYALAIGVVLPLATLLSAVSYHVIEKPFLSFRVQYVEGRFLTSSATKSTPRLNE